MTQASKKYSGISRQSINHNCVGRTKKTGDFRWKYVKDERYANIVPSLGFLPQVVSDVSFLLCSTEREIASIRKA